MILSRFACAAALLILSACTSVPPPPAPAFYVVRHLHTPEGVTDPDLTEEGQRHAQLLANRFDKGDIAVIYVNATKRTQQTAAPLAAKLGLTPKMYDPKDTPALVAMMKAETGPVLAVGHSNTVPDIVAALGGERPAPLSHPDFGDIWRVGPDGATLRKKIE